MFNTMRKDVVFQIPDAFLPLLHPGDPTTLRSTPPPRVSTASAGAPASGEVYIKATINAELPIAGVITMNGYIGITRPSTRPAAATSRSTARWAPRSRCSAR